MNKKREPSNKLILIFLAITVLILAHTFIIFKDSLDIRSFTGKISGNVVAEDNFKEESKISFKEKMILSAEWVLILVVFLKLLIQVKAEIKEYDVVIDKSDVKQDLSNNDLDRLYSIVKEKKTIGVKVLATYFKVSENVIIEWAKILEEANLLTIHYPNFSHPVLFINEEVVTNESKKK